MRVFTENGCKLFDNRHIKSYIINRINLFPVELLIDSTSVTITKRNTNSFNVSCTNSNIQNTIINILNLT